jgi:hypothetical protein
MSKLMQWLKWKARQWRAPQLVDAGIDWEKRAAESAKLAYSLELELTTVRGKLSEKASEVYRLRGELHRLRAPFAVVDGEQPDWPVENSTSWRIFLKTPQGQKLLAAANYQEQACNRRAISRTDPAENNFANNAGYARGWKDCTNYFFKTLTVDVPPKEDEATESAPGAADIRERLAP